MATHFYACIYCFYTNFHIYIYIQCLQFMMTNSANDKNRVIHYMQLLTLKKTVQNVFPLM